MERYRQILSGETASQNALNLPLWHAVVMDLLLFIFCKQLGSRSDAELLGVWSVSKPFELPLMIA